MPESGVSMLRRLFHSPGTIASFSVEPLKAVTQEPGYTKLRGWRYALKTQKPVPSTHNLRIPTGDCIPILWPIWALEVHFRHQK